jgi:hypothetical protein
MAAGWRTPLNGLPVLLTVSGPSPGTRPAAFPSGSGTGRRRPAERTGREPAGPWPANPFPVGCHVFPVPVEPPPAPRRARRAALPREHTQHRQPTCSPRTRAACAASPDQSRNRVRAQDAAAPASQTRAAHEGENGLQTTAVRRPGTARTGGNGTPGTSRVHTRYSKGPHQVHRTSGNRRGVPRGPAEASRSHSLPTARWPPAPSLQEATRRRTRHSPGRPDGQMAALPVLRRRSARCMKAAWC